jgi:hypothetical protein
MFMIKKNKQEDALIHKIWFVIASKGQVAIASTVVNYFFNYLHTAFSIFVRADFVHLLVRQGSTESKFSSISVNFFS